MRPAFIDALGRQWAREASGPEDVVSRAVDFFNREFVYTLEPPPLTSEGQVTYAPGNPKPTVDQMAADVAAFLVWTAEPNLQGRHKTGWAVLAFLIVATILAYIEYTE